jgi:arylsulfatase A-like enzyme
MRKTSRREFIKKTGLMVGSASALSTFPAISFGSQTTGIVKKTNTSRPNILLITTDTSRCDTVNAMGYPFAVSPHLDKLAKQGILFKNAHTSSPVCSPARCCLLTGLHTPIHGCIENGVNRRTDLTTFPDLLKEQGYKTIMVGKTHFGSIPDSFDVQKVLTGGKKNDADDLYADFIRKHGYSRKLSSYPSSLPVKLHIDSFLVDTTISEIEKSKDNDETPFFAFCSIPSPHPPLDPPQEWIDTYKDISLPPLNYTKDEFKKLPKYLIDHLDIKDAGTYDMEKVDKQRRLYYSLAAYCDAQIGRLVDYLDSSGLRENTLVIFSSDHGTTLFDHGFKNKHTFYDSSWRIPLMMSMPGTLPEGQTREFAIWNDITTSILGAAGIESDFMQGFDLFTPLSNKKQSPRSCAVSVHHRQCALATKKWKIIYDYDYNDGRLFDRVKDPQEQKNLYNDPEFKDVQNELFQALLQWNSELIDVERLRKNTGGGGRVAKLTAKYTNAMRGIDAEQRLNERAEKIDEKY